MQWISVLIWRMLEAVQMKNLWLKWYMYSMYLHSAAHSFSTIVFPYWLSSFKLKLAHWKHTNLIWFTYYRLNERAGRTLNCLYQNLHSGSSLSWKLKRGDRSAVGERPASEVANSSLTTWPCHQWSVSPVCLFLSGYDSLMCSSVLLNV